MFRYLSLALIFIIYSNAQVAPYHEPYSLINSDIQFLTSQLSIDDDFISFSYMNNASATILPDGVIYRLSLSFDIMKSGHVSIQDWNVPDGAMLFIFNDSSSYTGPYLSQNQMTFMSGRFMSERLIFEYFEPINSIFSGSFKINGISIDYLTTSMNDPQTHYMRINHDRERPKIMVTGYWPPTNEMVRHFSQDPNLNPDGWEGENWENLGFDIVSFFPEFNPPDCNNCGQGYGNLEVDYQDFSQDFWPIINSVQPVGIITFSRGFNDMSWELENRVVNRTNWYEDYTEPLLPTPNPPDDTVDNYHVRYTSLPVEEIISAVFDAHLGLDAYLDNTNAGMFLSEFAGYHGVWYKETHEDDNEIPCFSGGHIHVGAQIDWDTAKEATEASLRTLINHVSQFMVISGDCNSDGEVNILDIISLTNVILGFSESQTLAADMDENGQLDILDIIAIVNLILTF